MQESFRRKIIALVLIIGLFVSVYPLQRHIDLGRMKFRGHEELLYLPSGNFLKVVSLGFEEALADILLIKMIDYFATHLKTDRTYTWLYHMADVITTLDPNFRFPYVFAGVLLNLEANQFENARKILLKGMPVFKDDWYFPFALGLNYFFHEADLLLAADYFDKASNLPGAPEYLAVLSKKLKEKGKTKETTLEFLHFLYDSFPTGDIKKILMQRIIEIETGVR